MFAMPDPTNPTPSEEERKPPTEIDDETLMRSTVQQQEII
jgi:hypothetical protein